MAQELYVYIHLANDGWVPAGLLEYEESGRLSSSSFRYGKKYLERPGAVSIDPVQLPLQDTTFTTAEGFSIFNGIRDSGPDKWGRYLLDKKFGRALTELEYVAAVGSDRVGALAFSNDSTSGPKILTPKGYQALTTKHLDLALCVKAVKDVEAEKESEQLKQYLLYGPSLGGARPKATVVWNGKLHLAKFSLAQDHRNEPTIEYATMKLAKKVGLNVPKIEKTEAAGRSVYLIERFDRKKDGTPIPFLSGLTITGNHESDYSSWSYHALVDAIIKYSSEVTKDLKELFSRMTFNIMVYNNDDHLRNFGFLSYEKDRFNLSPLYDVVPATVSTQSFSLAMTVGTQGKKASISNALSQHERFRLTLESANEIIENMQEIVDDWRDDFRACGVKASEIKALENSFSKKPE